jgi:hypothetical protein
MSKKVDFYKQCTLRKDNTYTVAWIDAKRAIIGETVTIKHDDGSIDEGWKVETASSPLAASIVEANERNYKKQRKASDIIFSDIKKANQNAGAGF